MAELPSIEVFENQFPSRDYEIKICAPEFTSVCPKTGHPDFGTITINYIPNKTCVELKSYKYYLQAFRNKGVFYETLVNEILDDFVEACKPRECCVVGDFNARGGITTSITATYNE